eukprot:Platyproteum_vivax@DN10191_c0_g1_i1.p1
MAELDRYIVGQNEAKRSLAIAIRERWRRKQIKDPQLQKEISPNNILLIGRSGTGKTELAKRLASFAQAPFVKVVATKYTEIGFVGEDTSTMVGDLVEQAYAEEVKRSKKQVAERVAAKTHQEMALCFLKTDAGAEYTEESALQAIQDGKLEDAVIYIDREKIFREEKASYMQSTPMGVMAATHRSAMPPSPVDMSSKKTLRGPKLRLTVKEARSLLSDAVADAMVATDEVQRRACFAAEEMGIIFIDELDKLVDDNLGGRESAGKKHGVQKELLGLMEGTTINTRLGRIKTDHILFIGAGAFSTASPHDISPELQGRLPIWCRLHSLTKQDLIHILKSVEFNLLMQQQALLQTEGVDVEFTENGIEALAEAACKQNSATSDVGARRLKTVLAKVLEEVKFKAPKNKVYVTAEMVKQKGPNLKHKKTLVSSIVRSNLLLGVSLSLTLLLLLQFPNPLLPIF